MGGRPNCFPFTFVTSPGIPSPENHPFGYLEGRSHLKPINPEAYLGAWGRQAVRSKRLERARRWGKGNRTPTCDCVQVSPTQTASPRPWRASEWQASKPAISTSAALDFPWSQPCPCQSLLSSILHTLMSFILTTILVLPLSSR